jgi:hypothetical protein
VGGSPRDALGGVCVKRRRSEAVAITQRRLPADDMAAGDWDLKRHQRRKALEAFAGSTCPYLPRFWGGRCRGEGTPSSVLSRIDCCAIDP